MAGSEVGRILGATDSSLILRIRVLRIEVAVEVEPATVGASGEKGDWLVVVIQVGRIEVAAAIRARTIKVREPVAPVGVAATAVRQRLETVPVVAGKLGARPLLTLMFGRGWAEAEEKLEEKPCSTPMASHRTGTTPHVHREPLWIMGRGTVGGNEVPQVV